MQQLEIVSNFYSSSWMYLRYKVPSCGYAGEAATNHGKALGACRATSIQCRQQKGARAGSSFGLPPAWQIVALLQVTCHTLLDCSVPGTAWVSNAGRRRRLCLIIQVRQQLTEACRRLSGTRSCHMYFL